MIIDLFRLETEGFLASLAQYSQKLEAQIPTIAQTEFDEVRAWAKEESAENAEYEMAVDELRWNYEYFFPRSLRYSFVVLLFLVVERQLTKFCGRIQKTRSLPIRVTDLRGSFIERCKKYIHKLGGVPETPDWGNVENLAVVRNCIVHTMGQIEGAQDHQRLRTLASPTVGLTIADSDFKNEESLQLSQEYCIKVVQDMQIFFAQLFDSADIAADTNSR